MARLRSPNYPQFNLAESLDRIRRIYQQEHTHPAPREVLVKHLGYSGMNGASAVALGSLNRYGLLEAAGDGLRVSDEAVAILELPESDPQRVATLRELAFRPTLFAELYQQFGNQLPSEGSLRHSLIKQGFLPRAADEVIKIYRDNLTLVVADTEESSKDSDTTYNEKGRTIAATPMKASDTRMYAITTSNRALSPEDESPKEELRFKIAPKSEARIIFNGAVTQESIRKLIALLELSTDSYPTRADLESPPEDEGLSD